jgi:glutamate--cysteine ligase
MPAPQRTLDPDTVRLAIDAHLDAPVTTDHLGLEVEWLVSDPTDRVRRPTIEEVEAARASCGPLPRGGRLTIEPGGQLELATEPHPGVDELCEAATEDLVHLAVQLAPSGLDLLALGHDPVRPPDRVTDAPRYRAMQQHFDQANDAGRTMMCNTAAIQLNVGRGDPVHEERRWRTANALGPMLSAVFANSPFDAAGVTGWRSTRLRAWWAIDPSRAGPVALDAALHDAWPRYVVDASVMLIRQSPDAFASIAPGFSFARWLHEGHELGWPTEDDLAYHLTTLFPPVRPRGWLELRMFDTLPSPYWLVAAAVASSLLHADLHDDVSTAIAGTEHLWVEAAQHGLALPELAAAARRCFSLARQQLEARGVDAGVQAVVATFDERWVQRGRCLADDAIERWQRTGDVFPQALDVVPFTQLATSVS